MATGRMVIPGIVKNGLIVPQGPAPLPEGTQVEIVIPAPELPAEVRAEFDAWERAGDEAWSLIDQWEQEEPSFGQALGALRRPDNGMMGAGPEPHSLPDRPTREEPAGGQSSAGSC